ncbi:MAG: helix-turn-helix transcriptional regulator [Acidimicrobiia bacterium]
MASTGERMLELLALLQRRHRWSGQELADQLEVSERTLRRDVERLRALGYPVHASRGVDGGYQLGTGTKLPPLLLSDDEAVAIAIGLRSAANQPFTGIAESSMGALIKIGQVLSPALQRRVESITTAVGAPPALNTDSVALATLTTLARASRDAERVRFGYRGAGAATSERHVEPHHVVPLDQRWYLVAWDLDKDDWRTFRLDRIDEPRSTNRPFALRSLPAEDPTKYLRQKIAKLRAVHKVVLVVDSPVESVQRHMGSWGTASNEGPETTRIEMEIPDLGWAVLMLAVLNAEIREVEPARLRELLLELGQKFVAVTETA